MLGKANIHKLVVSAMMLALALVLPFLTGQIPQVGKMLCPMHFPVLLCGFFELRMTTKGFPSSFSSRTTLSSGCT